jgi:hypothetical protein
MPRHYATNLPLVTCRFVQNHTNPRRAGAWHESGVAGESRQRDWSRSTRGLRSDQCVPNRGGDPAPAAVRSAAVRSRIMARPNAAKAPINCVIIRAAGVVVSMILPTERNSAPALPTRPMMCGISWDDRDRRSSFLHEGGGFAKMVVHSQSSRDPVEVSSDPPVTQARDRYIAGAGLMGSRSVVVFAVHLVVEERLGPWENTLAKFVPEPGPF